jgi:hypothetical protein
MSGSPQVEQETAASSTVNLFGNLFGEQATYIVTKGVVNVNGVLY